MRDEKSESGALELFFKQRPSFRKVYNDAPDGAKEYYRRTCLASVKAFGDNTMSSTEEDVEWENFLHLLTDADWEYLKSHAPTGVVGCGLQVTQNRIQRENRERSSGSKA